MLSFRFFIRHSVSTIYKNQTRTYVRWGHRQPKKIFIPEDSGDYKEIDLTNMKDEIKLNDNNFKKTTKNWKNEDKNKSYETNNLKVLSSTNKSHSKKPKKIYEKPLNSDEEKTRILHDEIKETELDKEGNFHSTKLYDNKKLVASLMVKVKSKNQREKEKLILLEGKRLIRDALMCECKPDTIIYNSIKDLEFFKDLLPKKDIKLLKMTYRDIKLWSDLTTPPGVLGIFHLPKESNIIDKMDISLPLNIVCDNIRDPGNLGSILRTSAAVGCKQLLLTKGCVDVWDTKVLRSAAGAHFRLSIKKNLNWENIINFFDKNKSAVIIADNCCELSNDDNVEETEEFQSVTSKILKEEDKSNQVSLPTVPYYEVNYTNCSSLMLIIGGETHGISSSALNFAKSFNGFRVHIPLTNNVESLNSGTALGIIAYEIKRQSVVEKYFDDEDSKLSIDK